ncbi:unnamed protein product [Enterobius vermicularis]|uniref:Serine/threonine-protein kinase DDB_G0282963 n=1 Tax=Enterobius vermicularis TaxID=51028 RepID=A0A0N4VP79_ENTVE|nr:unnamed protein product [Enterobius vermicularis]
MADRELAAKLQRRYAALSLDSDEQKPDSVMVAAPPPPPPPPPPPSLPSANLMASNNQSSSYFEPDEVVDIDALICETLKENQKAYLKSLDSQNNNNSNNNSNKNNSGSNSHLYSPQKVPITKEVNSAVAAAAAVAAATVDAVKAQSPLTVLMPKNDGSTNDDDSVRRLCAPVMRITHNKTSLRSSRSVDEDERLQQVKF